MLMNCTKYLGPTYIPLILKYSRSDKLVNNNIINQNGTSCNRSRGTARKKDQTDLAKARLRTVIKKKIWIV